MKGLFFAWAWWSFLLGIKVHGRFATGFATEFATGLQLSLQLVCNWTGRRLPPRFLEGLGPEAWSWAEA